MLAATITAVVIYCMVQSSPVLALGTACWAERLSRAGRNGSCVGSQPFLIFGHGKAIHRMDLDGKNQRRLVAGVGSSILLDFHLREERVYWADKRSGVIYKASVKAHRQKLFSSDRNISGLAVDWIWNKVYWTSGEKGRIKRMDLNGKNVWTLLRHLTQPSSITVDPTNRFLFWLSGETTPSIQRSNLSGQMKTTLIKIAEQLKALSIDRGEKRLFWVQFGLQGESAIASCDYNGNVLHIINQSFRSQSLGISVFLENLYYTDTASQVIKQVDKYTGGDSQNVNIKPIAKPPVDIKVVHLLNQPMEDLQSLLSDCDEESGDCVSVCSSLAERGTCQCSEGFSLSKRGTHCEDVNECALWNHGCSLGCENIPGSYFCTCPEGYALLPDRKTCQEIVPCEGNTTKCGQGCLTTEEGAICVCPEGSLLQEDGQACTGCSSADRGGCSQLCTPVTPTRWQCDCLPGYQLHQDGKQCIASGPLPYLLVADLVDVRHINPDGTGDRILVEDPRGTIIALDYDPVQNKVYFASTSQKTIERVDLNGESREVLVSDGLDSPEGLAIDWIHRRMYWTDKSKATVECSTLAGLNRETIVSKGLGKPRGITVHPLAKKLFWTDIGARPLMESASLEGRDRVVIASTNLVSPSGLTIDFTEDRLFWCDQRRGLVETAGLDGSDRRVLLENQVGRPFDLAVFEDRLWISDREFQQLRSIHKRTGKKLQRIHGNLVQPGSIVVVHPLAKPGADICLHLNGGCAQVCESKLGFAHCSCLPRYNLSADGKSCSPADALNGTAESGDSEFSDVTSLKNKTFNDESTPVITPGLSTDTETNSDPDAGSEPTLITDTMVSDQNECYSLRCDVHAQCTLNAGSPTCLCVEGFTGDGQLCVDIDECKQGTHHCDKNAECQNTVGKYLCKCQAGYHDNGKRCQELDMTSVWMTTIRPNDVPPGHHNSSNSVERCPSSHESYCLYQGVCLYFPEMESYACNCLSGYMGERCQFSDLEWWELQQAEDEKRRNVVFAAWMVVLVSLLSIAACVTYCYGNRKIFRKQPSVDNMSETSVTDESMSETTSVPQFSMTAEKGVEGMVFPPMGCPRRAVCPSCSSETGDNPLSEESGIFSKHNRGYECSMVSAAVAESNQPTLHYSSPSLSRSCTSFKPHLISQTPIVESPAS